MSTPSNTPLAEDSVSSSSRVAKPSDTPKRKLTADERRRLFADAKARVFETHDRMFAALAKR